ncbi:MAG: rod shape-determining protein RodA [Calditrichaeota bacterium]|nr:rod shape-determining protein RodA [Calditrichota bacterium]RQW07671.1 MAG: rod shape-determining protein RodA [Calditrichota bacterium]
MFQLFKKIDYLLLISLTGLLVMGLLALYSTSHTGNGGGGTTNYFLKQLVWILIGLVLMFSVFWIPHKWIYAAAFPLYGISLFFLVLVIFVGKTGQGAERWIQMGPLSFQPSEFAKLATLLAVARFLYQGEKDPNQPVNFILAALFFVVPFLLIIRQPDLGTSMVFAAMALPVLYWAGLKLSNLFLIIMPFLIILGSFKFLTFLLLMAVLVIFLVYYKRSQLVIIANFFLNIAMGLLTPVLWNHLKPYQQNRIKIFLNPEVDPRGAGYQIIQSKVAFGSGGGMGKGFMEGSQTQLRFLPEQHTDFIYAVIGEEFGFLGAMLGLSLFFLLLFRGIQIATIVRNRFNSIVAIGIVTIIAFHTVINIGMTVGLLPVTGLPLPFISYGGSSLITNMVMIGILLNFNKNRYEY